MRHDIDIDTCSTEVELRDKGPLTSTSCRLDSLFHSLCFAVALYRWNVFTLIRHLHIVNSTKIYLAWSFGFWRYTLYILNFHIKQMAGRERRWHIWVRKIKFTWGENEYALWHAGTGHGNTRNLMLRLKVLQSNRTPIGVLRVEQDEAEDKLLFWIIVENRSSFRCGLRSGALSVHFIFIGQLIDWPLSLMTERHIIHVSFANLVCY